MAKPQDNEALRFYRVAFQRLRDAEALLLPLSCPAASIYLAGYAVECMLKALLILQTSVGRRKRLLESFRGSRAHDLRWLRREVSGRGVNFPPAVIDHLAYLSTWSVASRYEPGEGDVDDAKDFVARTHTFLAWGDNRI